ncbi:MAG: PilZ domain-containing protein [Fimbriimonadaceae bacterium]
MSFQANIDKRRYLRYDLLDYAMAYGDNDMIGVRSVIADVGLGGLALRTHEPLAAGEKLKLIVGRGSGHAITIRGLIRHVQLHPESRLYAIGVQFQPENHEERVTIAQYVHEIFQRRCDVVASNPG